MLNISFFTTAFLSVLWIFYGLRFVHAADFAAVAGMEALFQAVTVLLLPVAVLWGIFAAVGSFFSGKQNLYQMRLLLGQLKKNAENTNALGCALISAEKEVKNGFMLHEFNILISDINETLSDVIKRSNSISSAQMEHLWARTAGGERWLIAKSFIETYNYQAGFAEHLLRKAQKDSLLKGSILEFSDRMKSLYRLLEAHDAEKIFYNMIEYGAMGRVYAIISPLAAELEKEKIPAVEKNMAEKPAFAASRNRQYLTEQEEPFPSFLSSPSENAAPVRTPHGRNTSTPAAAIDSGLKAIRDELLFVPQEAVEEEEPFAPVSAKNFSSVPAARYEVKKEPVFDDEAGKDEIQNKKIISLDELEKEIDSSPENNYDEYAYPFGAWLNDKSGK